MKSSQLNLRQLFALAFAESRGAWRRMLFFILCIAIGVGAVMTVKSFSTLVGEAVQNQAKGLLSADIAIQGSWQQTREEVEYQKKILPAAAEFVFIKELHGMARFKSPTPDAKPGTLIAELKAVPLVGAQYPFYGELKSKPQKPLAALLANDGAVVEPSFLLKTNLQVGDKFSLGKTEVRITAAVLSEPDRISRAFSLGPRVFISRASLDKAKLIQPGSRIRHRTLIRLPPGFDPQKAVTLLQQGDKSISIRTYKDVQSSVSSFVERMGQYLSALGVIALLMGGIGVAMIIRTFMAQKLDTLAILNCLGASSRTLFKVYLLQSMLMGLAGSLVGIGVGFALTFLLPSKVEGLINLKLEPTFYWTPALQSLLLGCAVTLLFCLRPLLSAVKTPPLRLFRRNFEKEKQEPRRQRWISAATLGLGLTALISWQVESIKHGLIFLAALTISAGIFALASWLLLKLLRTLPPPRSIVHRYGVSNLTRPNSQATAIITCLGMGIMLILTVRLVQMDMLTMLNKNTESRPPNYFFVDIQHDQRKIFTAVLDQVAPEAERTLTPLVRSRLHSIDGKLMEGWEYQDKSKEEWFITREFVLTSMADPPGRDNEIIAGKWWDAARRENAEVSLEQDAAKILNAEIGSQLTVNIQGIPTTATVTSIRKVNWRSLRTNFYMIYSPGALQDAPLTYVATVHVPDHKELPLQHAVIAALPNITALSTRNIIDTIESTVTKLITLVDFMSGFAIAAGLLILTGSIASTKFRRLRESAILKILGARRKVVAAILGDEYAALGVIAALVGITLAQGLSWAVMKYMIKSDWHLYPTTAAWAFCLAVLITVTTGIASNLDVVRAKPLKTLRKSEN